MAKWIIDFILNSDLKSFSVMQLKASKEFKEEGRFTSKQCKEIIKYVRKEPMPEFTHKDMWGYLTYVEWHMFRERLHTNIQIMYPKKSIVKWD